VLQLKGEIAPGGSVTLIHAAAAFIESGKSGNEREHHMSDKQKNKNRAIQKPENNRGSGTAGGI
jgi:hypothetical protein